MKTYVRISFVVSICLFVGLFLFIARAVLAENPDGGWQTLAPGIEYQEFRQFDSDAYVARMEITNTNVTIDSIIAGGTLSGGTEQVSGMFNRYEDTINNWHPQQKWGNRNDVVVAINGYFYGPPVEPPGVPWRGQIHSGWYAKRHDNNENGSGFVWKLDRTAFVGECVFHQPAEQLVTFAGTTTTTLKITDINAPREDDQLILYTPQFDADTQTNDDGVEVLVEMTRPTLILPPSLSTGLDLGPFQDWLEFPPPIFHDPSAEALGYVRQILDGQGSMTIPFDHVVLSATGLPREKLLENLQVDMEIGISQAVAHLSNDDCVTPVTGKDWTKAYASVGGSFYFLEDGLIDTFPGDPQANAHDPRTAIAYNEDHVFFIVVDGRNPGVSEGMNMGELGYFARETLGADFGIAQDGGGSSTMVVNGEVVNVPSDEIIPVPCNLDPFSLGGSGTPSFLPIVINAQATPGVTPTPSASPTASPSPTPSLTPTPTGTPGICYQGTERFVANGMMMVVVAPMMTSTLFTPGQSVETTIEANLRLGPGTNYPVLATLPAGSTGTVKAHSNNLDGVLATGLYWWKVNFGGGQVGWISESVLTGGP